MGRQAAETQAGGSIDAPVTVTVSLTYLHAGRLQSLIRTVARMHNYLGKSQCGIAGARVRGPTGWSESAGRPKQRNLKGHSDMNAVQASVLWRIASDKEMSTCIFHRICCLIRKRVPSYIKCLA